MRTPAEPRRSERAAIEPAAAAPDPSVALVSCVVADDHPVVVNAVSEYLTARGITVVARAGDGDGAIAQIAAFTPSVAVLNRDMPGLSGIEVARRTRRTSPGTATILFTGSCDRALLDEAMDAGVCGVVLKQAPLPELLRAVTLAAAGTPYLDPILAGMIATTREPGDGERLTRREREVLRLLADGLSNEEIGRDLFIGAETVRTHIRKAMNKLSAGTRTEAVATALRMSLIS